MFFSDDNQHFALVSITPIALYFVRLCVRWSAVCASVAAIVAFSPLRVKQIKKSRDPVDQVVFLAGCWSSFGFLFGFLVVVSVTARFLGSAPGLPIPWLCTNTNRLCSLSGSGLVSVRECAGKWRWGNRQHRFSWIHFDDYYSFIPGIQRAPFVCLA